MELQGEAYDRAGLAKLKRTGTVLAVVWANNSSSESRTKVVQAVLERNGMTAAELNGEARDIVLKSFVSGAAWYHDPDVDDLSKQKAITIAARLVHMSRQTSRYQRESQCIGVQLG